MKRRGTLLSLLAAGVVGIGVVTLINAGPVPTRAGAASSLGGPVILGGDDLTDHGSVTSSGLTGQGWLYIQRALENINPKVTRAGNDGTVAALGSTASTATSSNAGAAIGAAAAQVSPAPLGVTYHDGATAIQAFFDAVAAGSTNPAIIWISGNGAGNDLSSDESAALTSNAVDIADFVNSGGGLMSHGTAYGWLSSLLPGVSTVNSGSSGDLYLTAAGAAAFPGVTDADVNAGPWHNHFEPAQTGFAGLEVLVRSTSVKDATDADAAVVIGGAAATLPGSITLDPAEATNEVGTNHTVTATLGNSSGPVEGVTVTFTVTTGPNAGKTGSAVSDSAGAATFTYHGDGGEGTDVIRAEFTDAETRRLRSTTAQKHWIKAAVAPIADEVLPVLFKKDGYLLVGGDGGIFADPIGGSTNFVGAASVNRVPPKLVLPQSLRVPSAQIVGVDIMQSLEGYWLAGADGGVYAIGDAPFSGSMGNKTLTAPIVGIAADPDGTGYWLAGTDGAVYAFDAPLHGSMFGTKLNAPIVGIAAHPGGGFYLVASDGGVFAFGGAPFSGSLGNIKLDKPIVGIAVDPDGRGYLLGASDGGVFAIDASFAGSVANLTLAAPVVGIVADPDGTGYWLAAEDGGVFALDAPYYGSVAHVVLNRAIVGIAGT